MFQREDLRFFTPEDMIIFFLGLYNKEYGEAKGLEVISKVINSNKIQNFIIRLRSERLNPGEDGFITVVNSIPYFLFSKSETLGYGTLSAIHKWLQESSNDEFQLSYNVKHNIVVESIFRAYKTKLQISNSNNFFDKFFLLLGQVLEKSFENIQTELKKENESDDKLWDQALEDTERRCMICGNEFEKSELHKELHSDEEFGNIVLSVCDSCDDPEKHYIKSLNDDDLPF